MHCGALTRRVHVRAGHGRPASTMREIYVSGPRKSQYNAWRCKQKYGWQLWRLPVATSCWFLSGGMTELFGGAAAGRDLAHSVMLTGRPMNLTFCNVLSCDIDTRLHSTFITS